MRSPQTGTVSNVRVTASNNENIRVEVIDTVQWLARTLEQRLILGMYIQVLKPGTQNPDLPFDYPVVILGG
jgi:hypothetical protein